VNGLNLSERNLFILNVFIVLAMFPFLALSANDFLKLRLAGNVLPDDSDYARSHAAQVVSGTHPRAYYNQIVTRDIFNLAPPPAPPPVEDENLDVKLVGTSQLSVGKPFAIVEDSEGKQSLYQVGQEIPGAGQLLEVSSDRIVVLHNGRRVALDIPRQPAQSGPAMRVPPSPGFIRRIPRRRLRELGRLSPGIRRLGSNNYLLTRSTVDNNIKNMAPLFTQIRATPQIENGVADGYRLTEIQPDSIFQQIGLQDGDLLKSVNGQSVGDPAKAMLLLQSLQSQPSITLDVLRNGSPSVLHYSIH